MPTITQFDRTNLKDIREDLERSMNATLEKYGVKASIGTLRFTAAQTSGKITMSLIDGSSIQDTSKQEYELFAPRFGLEKDTFGKVFVLRGKMYTVCGIKPSAHQYPILAKQSNGRVYKFSALTVKSLLK